MNKTLVAILAALACWQVNAETPLLTDLPAAQAQAKAENKILLMDFTGSDWCPACIQFKKQVLDSDTFQAYAAKNVVTVELDFPDKIPQSAELKKTNAALRDKYNIEGYPTLVALDKDGKEIGRQLGYDATGPTVFIAKLQSFKAGK